MQEVSDRQNLGPRTDDASARPRLQRRANRYGRDISKSAPVFPRVIVGSAGLVPGYRLSEHM